MELSEGGGLAQCDDGTLKDDNPYKVACELLNLKALPLVGRETPNGEKMKETLEKAGFVDVTLVKTKVPIGPWAKDRNWKNIGAIVSGDLSVPDETHVLIAGSVGSLESGDGDRGVRARSVYADPADGCGGGYRYL